MNASLLDAKIKNYREKIKHLDEVAHNRLDDDEYRSYAANRDRFAQRLTAWKKTLGSDLAIFKQNVEDGYHELEAHLTARSW